MYGIEVLVKEHENIMRMATVMRKACLSILEGNQVETKDFYEMIDFVRNYADKHHHKKEEDLLFKFMEEELGELGKKLVTHGMLIEHDYGRLYMMDLEKALKKYDETRCNDAKLDIIANATGYTYLISRHVDKEDTAVYTFAQNKLKEETKKIVDIKTKELEDYATEHGIQNKYIDILNNLERKYN